MVYTSQISFTLDTICPWTYIALKRLTQALTTFTTDHPSSPVRFTLKFFPYQLYPDTSPEGEEKFAWYKQSRYGDSEEKMRAYTTIMSAYGRQSGIEFRFGGVVANTLNAMRIVCYWQEKKGAEVARKIIECRFLMEKVKPERL
jgi:predicted DsbA family dithiol-disulfide isomerase